MGNIAHLRNQFKSINTFAQSNDYIISLILERKKTHHLLFDYWTVLICKTWVPFNQGWFVPKSLAEIGPVVLADFKFSSMYFRCFVIVSPWKKARPFIWTNLNSLHSRMLCAKFRWNWLFGSGEEDKNVKCLQTDKWTDERRTTGNRKSSLEPSVQVS